MILSPTGEAALRASQTILSFRLQGEVFALPVARIHEIIDPLPMTRVPNTDPFVPGLINVRGSVVPVVDLRQRLGMPDARTTEESRMVVLDTEIRGETTKLALLADGVDQVTEIAAGTVEAVPEIGIRFPVRFLGGIAKRAGDLIILLNPDTAFAPVDRDATPH